MEPSSEGNSVRPPAGRFPLTVASASFVLLHVAVLAVLLVPFQGSLLLLALGSYLVRMFAVTGGYHRYFSHRTFRTSRAFQFVLAFLAQSTGQKGVIWWAAHHRHHHGHADEPVDVHSPLRHGFFWSHVGWILSDTYDRYDPKLVPDLLRFPELRFLDRHHWISPWLLGLACFLLGVWTGWGGWATLVWGFVVPTVALFHATFLINSMAHLWGTRRFATRDGSRNNALLALLTLGEGWHNNHHAYPAAVRQGFRWWEFDPTFYVLKVLSWVRIVRDLRGFPSAAYERAGLKP